MFGSAISALISPTAHRCYISLRSFSASSSVLARNTRSKLETERIVTTSDGAVIVCWHPEKKFPYEFTRPVPRADAAADTNQK